MTENLPIDGVQSRQAVFVRCCLKPLVLCGACLRHGSIVKHDRASINERLRESLNASTHRQSVKL